MTSAPPIPPQFKLLIEFVNTREFDPVREHFVDGEAVAGWLKARGLLDADIAAGAADAADAREVREALRTMATHNAGDEPPEHTEMPAWCTQVSYRLAADGDRLVLQPAGARTTVRGALRSILALVYRAQIEGTWTRLKTCRKHSCLWAFYDQSKNRSGAWCNMAVCGNREKAQRRRQRERVTK